MDDPTEVTLNPALSHDEMVQQVLELQCDAFTRAFVLRKDKRNVTFEDVLRILANAERDAQYICGFVGLEGDTKSKLLLLEKLKAEELILEDANGNVTLTTKGEERSKNNELPSQIEEHI